jgi:hypothetical protein
MLVKDEVDILKQCLEDALTWADGIFIIDNGSTDGSWELMQSMKSDRIIPWKQDFTPYRRTLRAEIFEHFRHLSHDGDWWFFGDADEFYVDNPRQFLSKVPSQYQVVFKKSIDYFITNDDIDEYTFSGDFQKDQTHIRYIEPNCWAEIRFFKYREKMIWNTSKEKPDHLGLWYQKPIIVKHYQYRSPQQMQRRLDIRNSIPKDREGKPFRHVKQKNWQELLRPRSELVRDNGYDQYIKLPLRRPIKEKTSRVLYKRLIHGMGLVP